MKLFFDKKIAESYSSHPQRIRVMTESWVDENIFCPNCGQESLTEYPNNKPVADFFCAGCVEDFELKSKKNSTGSKIVDGAYNTMIERLDSAQNPNFFLLTYSSITLGIKDFLVVPKHFFVPEIIERRRPLSSTAKRAGWTGCNIDLRGIPESGKIFYVKAGTQVAKEDVLHSWKKTIFLREATQLKRRSWLLDTLKCIEELNKREFTLDEIYFFESKLQTLHPENNHVRDKIRQQLQILRDKGYLSFKKRGIYTLS